MARFARLRQLFPVSGAILLVLVVAPQLAGVGGLSAGNGAGFGFVPASYSCASVASNASLVALVDQYYLHSNSSLLPSQSTAESAAVAIWETVCSSSPFNSVYSTYSDVSFADSAQVQDKNVTAGGIIVGSLFVSFKLTWNTSCPSGATRYPVGFGCVFSDVWSGNLTTGKVAGPAQGVVSARFIQCDTPSGNLSNVQAVDGFYPNPFQRPNQSTAEQEVQTLWGEVCSSETYYQTLNQQPGATPGGVSAWTTAGGMNASGPGDLFVQWSIGWTASCAQGPSCFYSEEWTADLLADTVTGPRLSISIPLGSPPGPGSGSFVGKLTDLSTPIFGVSIAALILVSVLGVALYYKARGPRIGSPSRIYQGFSVRDLRAGSAPSQDRGHPSKSSADSAGGKQAGGEALDELLR